MRALVLVIGIALSGVNCAPAGTPPVELWLGGDVHLGSGTQAVLDSLEPLPGDATGIVNLEGPVAELSPGSGRAITSDSLKISNAPPALRHLRSGGVRLVTVENNHASDYGPEGVVETRKHLLAAGIEPVSRDGIVLERPELRIVFTAHDLGGGVPPGLAGDLARARRRGEVLVAAFHVTGPPSYLPPPELREAVNVALEAGARVVVAHGLHAPGAVERRGGAIIAWGLGNLAFACDCTAETDGLILKLSFVSADSIQARVCPVEAGLNGLPARPAGDADGLFDLLEAIGSPPLTRDGPCASF